MECLMTSCKLPIILHPKNTHTHAHMSVSKTIIPWQIHIIIIFLFYLIAKSAISFHNIADALGFYGVYHRDPWNQLIHFFGVPAIIWSLLIFLAHVPLPFLLNQSFTYADILTVFYFCFYLKIDPIGGVLYAPFLYWMYTSATRFVEQSYASTCYSLKKKKEDHVITSSSSSSSSGSKRALKIATIVHLTGWYVQIHPGHFILEGAVPAVTKSVGGALTSAPLFAFYEGLWFLGIRKQLQVQTLELVDQYTRELCKTGTVSMRACLVISQLDHEFN